MVFTLWSGYNQDKLKYGSLGGHELHHQLRSPPDMGPIKPEDEGIMYLLNNIVNEGTADMVDKHYGLDNLKTIPTEFQFDDMLLNRPDSIIRQIDTALQVMNQSMGASFKTIKQYRKLINYSSGHDPGYYMADIIVRNGFKKELLKNIQSPFYFVYLYNKAASKDARHPPVFSASAISYVKKLEKRYWGR